MPWPPAAHPFAAAHQDDVDEVIAAAHVNDLELAANDIVERVGEVEADALAAATAALTSAIAAAQALVDDLSGVSNAAAARGNLGLGTAATANKVAAGAAGVLDATDSSTTNQRVPTDGSVTNAKVAVGAAILLNKLAEAVYTTAQVDTAIGSEATTRAAQDALLIPLAQKGAANGVATLGADGKIPTAQQGATVISEFLGDTANEAAMLALVGQRGDWTCRTDTSTTWILKTDDPTLLANWKQLLTPTDAVLSVNGQTGVVTITAASLSDLVEQIQDAVGTWAFGGSGLSLVYDDTANTLVLNVNVDDASIEVSSDTLRVKAGGITNAMLAGSIAQSKVTDLTADLSGKQTSHANLTALAGLTGAADKGVRFTGAGAMTVHDLTAFARTILDDPDVATARATMGVPQVEVYNTAGNNTVNTPAWAKGLHYFLQAAGGGGGGGRSGDAGTARVGGGTGGTGGTTWGFLHVDDLGGSVNLTVGAGGTSGAGVTSGSAGDGGAGGTGGNTYLGPAHNTALASAQGGTGGGGGAQGAGGGAGSAGTGLIAGSVGVAASSSGAAGSNGTNGVGPSAGGSGGGITTGNAASNGGSGGVTRTRNGVVPPAGGTTGGTVAGTSATNPAPKSTTYGHGGGGGASSTSGAGGAGGNGIAGGSGGGGGASVTGNNSGAGGTGGAGWAILAWVG